MPYFIEKIKRRFRVLLTPEIGTIFIIILVGFGSFGLGRLSALQEHKTPVRILYPGGQVDDLSASVETSLNDRVKEPSLTIPALSQGGQIVASKSGTKYHFPWCSGGKTISEKNKIWFDSVEEARAAGYQPAGNCKGLK